MASLDNLRLQRINDSTLNPLGKTRYGRELYNALQRELTSAAKAKGFDYAPHYYYMLLDFYHGVNLRSEEAKFSAETILGLRLAYAHFFQGKYQEGFPEFCYEAAKHEKLFTIRRVIIAIRQALKLPEQQPLFLFLHIDEFQKIFDDVWKVAPEGHPPAPPPEGHTEEGVYLFREMMRSLGPFMGGEINPDMIQTFLSGTARQEVIQTAEPTFYSFEFLSCPTLSMGARYDIMRYFVALSEVRDYEWMPKMAFLRLLSATGGLPRALQLLLEEFFGYRLEKCSNFRALVDDISLNADQIFDKVANNLDKNYSITAFAQKHQELVRALVRLCIFQQPCLRLYAPSDQFPNLTLDVLERHAHTILEDSSDARGRVLVRIPFFFLYIYDTAIGEIRNALGSAFVHDWGQDHEWRFFERIIAEYEVLRTNVLIDNGCTEATLGNIYKGALGRAETLNVAVKLKMLSLVKAAHQFPKMGGLTVNGKELGWKSGVVVKNADGASFANVFVYRDNADTEGPGILCALQAKNVLRLPAETFVQEHAKNTKAIVDVPEGSKLDEDGIKGVRTITVIITTADADSVLQTFGETFPEDCLLIHRGNFAEFFGEAFSATADFAATSDRNVNFTTREHLKKKHKLEDAVVNQVMENMPFRSYDDLVSRVPAMDSIQPTEMEFLPYEELGRTEKRRRLL
jgi:hypothetical protein